MVGNLDKPLLVVYSLLNIRQLGHLPRSLPEGYDVSPRFIQLKMMPRMYYTPQRLSGIYPHLSANCLKCSTDEGSLLHMLWTCARLQDYSQGVVSVVNTVGKVAASTDTYF